MQAEAEIQPTRTVPGFSLDKPDKTNSRYVPWSSDRVESSIDKEKFPQLWAVMDGIKNPEVMPFRSAISEADRNRLVKARQCPTQEISPELAAFRAERDRKNKLVSESKQLAAMLGLPPKKIPVRDILPDNFGEVARHRATDYQLADLVSTGELKPAARKVEGGDGAYTVVSHRSWSDEWRIRTQVDQCAAVPPGHEGDRVTNSLTLSGARKLADSCHYTHLKCGGYRTFLTLTFDAPGRSRVDIRQAAGPFTELNTEKLGKAVITTGVKLAEIEKREGVWFPGRKLWHDTKLIAGSPDGDFSPVELIGGRYYAAATGETGADVTFGSIQKEVGRFFDAANKMRQRGWKAAKQYKKGRIECVERGAESRRYPWGMVECAESAKVVGEKASQVIGIKGYMADKSMKVKRLPVRYCWVVENPLNESGQRNPHVHILMDWRVRYSAFASWAARLESLWGQGFATLEKIKDTEKAGAYMAKAAGYITKGQGESDQGPVKGNRYGISALTRAPEWVCAGRYELGIMGNLIADTHDYFTALYGSAFAKRKQLKTALDETAKEDRGSRQKIGKTLEKVRGALNRLPAIASKYQLLIKGSDRFKEFEAWATGKDQFDGNAWLPPKAEGDAWKPDEPRPEGNWFKEFQFRMFAKRSARRFWGMPLSVYQQCIEIADVRNPKQNDINNWVQYEGL